MLPINSREIERLAVLHELQLFEAPPKPAFDAICTTAAALFGAPIALISLLGTDEQRFKGTCGWGIRGTPRALAFCNYTILSDDVFVIEDATQDGRFAANPFVIGEPHIRFYAGAPLIVGPGLRMGSLCVLDRVARTFSAEQRSQLRAMAQITATMMRLHRAEQNLREREACYRLLADHATDMIVRADLDGTRRYVSPASRVLLGYEPDELLGTKPLEFMHPEDVPEHCRILKEFSCGNMSRGVGQYRYRRKDGSWVWVEATFNLTHGADGRADGYVTTVRDISERKANEEHLTHLAEHDVLTGLLNRRSLDVRLEQAMIRTRSTGSGCALFCIDLDHFKVVNDTLGHSAGDTLLRSVADRLRATVREQDTVARLGGDEFVIIQAGCTDEVAAARLAQRLITAMMPAIDLAGSPITMGMSIGIALASAHGQDPITLYKRADEALYRAKAAGRNTFCFGPVTNWEADRKRASTT